jgi:hypothetical protein
LKLPVKIVEQNFEKSLRTEKQRPVIDAFAITIYAVEYIL